MSKTQSIPVSLKAIDAYLAAEGQNDMALAAKVAKELIDAIKESRKALTDGYNRKELTVCVGKLGFVCPDEVNKLLEGKIPKLTIYRAKKNTRHMPLYFKNTPKFYKEHPPCKTKPRGTNSTSKAGSPKRARPAR